MQTITVYGAGYVGLVSAACLASLDHEVICVDVDPHKIAMCESGRLPIYEAGLTELVAEAVDAGKLKFTTDLNFAAQHGEVQVVAVGTPYGQSGAADLDAYWRVIRHIVASAVQDLVIVTKSTVPVGTAKKVRQYIDEQCKVGQLHHRIGVASNPEFLRQGSAVGDFLEADRIVVGADDPEDAQVIHAMYRVLIEAGVQMMQLDATSAEFIKYASNAFLATKISFMNELSQIAEVVGADIEAIKYGMSCDHRINPAFLNPGCGYGGSCFPKDIPALIAVAKAHHCQAPLLSAVHHVNVVQKNILFKKAHSFFDGQLNGRSFAMWGLAFKPGTDDLREAPSVSTLTSLWDEGATVTAYDPVAKPKAALQFQSESKMLFADNMIEAAKGAEALFIMTEWDEFKAVDWDRLKEAMRFPVIFDGRNLYDPEMMRSLGFMYFPIGRVQSTVKSLSTMTCEM